MTIPAGGIAKGSAKNTASLAREYAFASIDRGAAELGADSDQLIVFGDAI